MSETLLINYKTKGLESFAGHYKMDSIVASGVNGKTVVLIDLDKPLHVNGIFAIGLIKSNTPLIVLDDKHSGQILSLNSNIDCSGRIWAKDIRAEGTISSAGMEASFIAASVLRTFDGGGIYSSGEIVARKEIRADGEVSADGCIDVGEGGIRATKVFSQKGIRSVGDIDASVSIGAVMIDCGGHLKCDGVIFSDIGIRAKSLFAKGDILVDEGRICSDGKIVCRDLSAQEILSGITPFPRIGNESDMFGDTIECRKILGSGKVLMGDLRESEPDVPIRKQKKLSHGASP